MRSQYSRSSGTRVSLTIRLSVHDDGGFAVSMGSTSCGNGGPHGALSNAESLGGEPSRGRAEGARRSEEASGDKGGELHPGYYIGFFELGGVDG